jgi:acetoacetate decarboxylase
MTQNRWVHTGAWRPAATTQAPVLPSLEAVYLTDRAVLASVLPPPLTPPEQPRVHVRLTEIDLTFPGGGAHREMVGFLAVDAVHDGVTGEYPLLIPIDLESALSISRERFGEPKKLAELALVREGDRVQATMTRQGVTFVEIAGEVTASLPVPEPYAATQFWYKFLPALSGDGFDAGPFLVRVDQVRTPHTLEQVEGKLVLRDCDSVPIADLPVEELVSITWTTRSSTVHPVLVGEVDATSFAPFAAARYDHV